VCSGTRKRRITGGKRTALQGADQGVQGAGHLGFSPGQTWRSVTASFPPPVNSNETMNLALAFLDRKA
jgi:hypothetical protein